MANLLESSQQQATVAPDFYNNYLSNLAGAGTTAATGAQYVTIRNYTKTQTGRILRVASATLSSSQVDYNRQIPFKIDEKTDFQFEAKSSASTNVIAMFVEGILQNKVPGSL